jgi:hypothetical protein
VQNKPNKLFTTFLSNLQGWAFQARERALTKSGSLFSAQLSIKGNMSWGLSVNHLSGFPKSLPKNQKTQKETAPRNMVVQIFSQSIQV